MKIMMSRTEDLNAIRRSTIDDVDVVNSETTSGKEIRCEITRETVSRVYLAME
jgi:hypothetical protein